MTHGSVRTAALVFFLAAPSAVAGIPFDVEWPAVASAPVRIVDVSVAPLSHEFTIKIESTERLSQVYVTAVAFSNGVRTAGFMLGREVELAPGETAVVTLTPQSGVLHEADRVVVVPSDVYAGEAGRRTRVWSLGAASLRQLGRGGIRESAGDARGAAASAPTPELPGMCCTNCSTAAGTCGQNYLQNVCRSSNCVASYSCKESYHPASGDTTCECNFSCKPAESCC